MVGRVSLSQVLWSVILSRLSKVMGDNVVSDCLRQLLVQQCSAVILGRWGGPCQFCGSCVDSGGPGGFGLSRSVSSVGGVAVNMDGGRSGRRGWVLGCLHSGGQS